MIDNSAEEFTLKNRQQNFNHDIAILTQNLRRQSTLLDRRDGILLNKSMMSSLNFSIDEESNKQSKNQFGEQQNKMTRFKLHKENSIEFGDSTGYQEVKRQSQKYKDFKPFISPGKRKEHTNWEQNDIKIDNGLSDMKKPYYPDFGLTPFYQFEDHQPANWRKLYDQLIRQPQHTALIQFIKQKNDEKEQEKKEKEEKEQQAKLNLLSNGLGLKRRLTLSKMRENREQEQKYAENSMITNPKMQKRYKQIGSKFKNLQTEVSKINQSYELFGGFLDHIKQQNIRKINQTADLTQDQSLKPANKIEQNVQSFLRKQIVKDQKEMSDDCSVNLDEESKQNLTINDNYKQKNHTKHTGPLASAKQSSLRLAKSMHSEPQNRVSTLPNSLTNSPMFSPTGQPKFIFKDRDHYVKRYEQKLQMHEKRHIQISELSGRHQMESLKVKSKLTEWLNESKMNNYMDFIEQKLNSKKSKKKRDRGLYTSMDFKRQIESPDISDNGEGRDMKPGEQFLNEKLFSDMSDQLTQTQTPLEKIDEKKKQIKVKKLPKMKIQSQSMKKRRIMETLNIYRNAIVLD